MLRLLRCRFMKSGPSRGPPSGSPVSNLAGVSILMTFAPQSASWRTQVGPERTRVRSSTVKRLSASEARGNGISFSRTMFSHPAIVKRARHSPISGELSTPLTGVAGAACHHAPAVRNPRGPPMNAPDNHVPRVPAERLRAFIANAFIAAGLPKDDARVLGEL